MKKHEVIVHIPSAEYTRVNHLLAIDSFNNMSERELAAQGVTMGHNEGIYLAKFDNGASINFDLCSGPNNYWDDKVWTSPDGSRDVILDCAFELSDVEVEIESEQYIVKIVIDE